MEDFLKATPLSKVLLFVSSFANSVHRSSVWFRLGVKAGNEPSFVVVVSFVLNSSQQLFSCLVVVRELGFLQKSFIQIPEKQVSEKCSRSKIITKRGQNSAELRQYDYLV